MTDPDIQNYRHLLKRLNEKMKFLRSFTTQAGFVMSNFEKIWTAVYFISFIRNWKKSFEKILKKSCSQ